MGSRAMPVECPVHPEVTIDWGGFGPCQGFCDEVHPDLLDQCLDTPGCHLCDAEDPTDEVGQLRAERNLFGNLLTRIVAHRYRDDFLQHDIELAQQALAEAVDSPDRNTSREPADPIVSGSHAGDGTGLTGVYAEDQK